MDQWSNIIPSPVNNSLFIVGPLVHCSMDRKFSVVSERVPELREALAWYATILLSGMFLRALKGRHENVCCPRNYAAKAELGTSWAPDDGTKQCM